MATEESSNTTPVPQTGHDEITITLRLPRAEAEAFAQYLKRTSYSDCEARADRNKIYPDGRFENNVMWSAALLVERQFRQAGFAPR